jgi:hypothetical protein
MRNRRKKLPSNTALLTHVGQTLDSLGEPQAVFQFDSRQRRYDSQNAQSNYQIQLAARYSF